MTTTTPNMTDYLTTRRAINALRDEQFHILTSRHTRDETATQGHRRGD